VIVINMGMCINYHLSEFIYKTGYSILLVLLAIYENKLNVYRSARELWRFCSFAFLSDEKIEFNWTPQPERF